MEINTENVSFSVYDAIIIGIINGVVQIEDVNRHNDEIIFNINGVLVKGKRSKFQKSLTFIPKPVFTKLLAIQIFE
jgi:NAD-dependent DNA ligase